MSVMMMRERCGHVATLLLLVEVLSAQVLRVRGEWIEVKVDREERWIRDSSVEWKPGDRLFLKVQDGEDLRLEFAPSTQEDFAFYLG